MELLTAAQMREIEQAAIASGRVTGLELMERAGRGVVEAVLEEWPEFATAPHRAVVLCGPGNNGGDGFVVARLLKQRGWDVDVFLYGEVEKLPPDAKVNAERWLEMGEVFAWNDFQVEKTLDWPPLPHLIIDALFGLGLNRLMPDDMERAWHGFMSGVIDEVVYPHDEARRFVAIDIRSGICSDSGTNFEGAFPANLTVTFHLPKLGNILLGGGPMPRYAPEGQRPLRVVDIGLPKVNLPEAVRQILGPTWNRNARKSGRIHKYAYGHALILAGGVGKGGAARLAARGALRIGAGLVTVAPPPAALIENAAQLNAIMLTAIKDRDALSALLEDKRINALCLGPGLGPKRARALVPVALASNRKAVLDADALTAFEEDPQALFDQLHKGCVLTPHMGEFGRLFPDLKAKLDALPETGPAYSKIDAARDAAARAGCTVLLKGPDTVIADPNGKASVNASVYERAAPWLATAGSGDVLAGFITGLLARGYSPHNAAASAAWLHTECALKFGPGLIAEDLPEQLPAVLADLEANSP